MQPRVRAAVFCAHRRQLRRQARRAPGITRSNWKCQLQHQCKLQELPLPLCSGWKKHRRNAIPIQETPPRRVKRGYVLTCRTLRSSGDRIFDAGLIHDIPHQFVLLSVAEPLYDPYGIWPESEDPISEGLLVGLNIHSALNKQIL